MLTITIGLYEQVTGHIKNLKNSVNSRPRLDILLVEKGIVQSRERAQALIMSGNIMVNGFKIDKAGTRVDQDSEITVKGDDIPYVSRGGLKLEKALRDLKLDITGMTCLDIGASTGGFTDCLLQSGASEVYAVDVGYGQLAWSLRQDPRVHVIERTNIRFMDFEVIGKKMDLVTIDTSFISLKLVVPASEKFMKKDTLVLALIKPQFEAGKERIGKKGVVRDPAVRHKIVEEIELFFRQRGYETGEIIESPVKGPKGNIEFILSMRYGIRLLNKNQ
ncbi:Putative hemolysin A-like rRNA methylase (FtsJ-like) [Desulfamplus magnetovallimortis]|uniref:Putative hemolysin A-like rRNA methylase (FtsJ-like) n=1 Tax=Desulfamplus magnetovallimortis TaxID=1246637 RepID=L0R6J9_9BACT|nr:Putative hemolysin A-like rRNA methylase (FtsJ-like) [Desulfamplus magnetovallimortis BW-1]SLM32682.1 Putative hemolysin A-like rRNA methylase (FtsJ-like) [Desulfamplus magnetovallimortis]